MKALIIENEDYIPNELEEFLDDNPDLFESVSKELYCKDRTLKTLGPAILAADAIIVKSTWLYKDQLEKFTATFASGNLGKKKFYIDLFLSQLNEWNTKRADGMYKDHWLFNDMEFFLSNVKKLVSEHEVYSIERDIDTPTDKKDSRYPSIPRALLYPALIEYNKTENKFFTNDPKYIL